MTLSLVPIEAIVVKVKERLLVLLLLLLRWFLIRILLHCVLGIDLLVIFFVEPLVGTRIFDAKESMFDHNEEDVLGDSKTNERSELLTQCHRK
jgi:hypothetical protein